MTNATNASKEGSIRNPRNVYLIGYRGAGKTTIAPKLAHRLGSIAIDLDQQIEVQERLSIAEIFQERGETVFRQLESGLLKEIASKNNLVVSTGGGIILDQANRELLRETGTVIWLAANPTTLLQRIEQDDNKRPALSSLPLLDEITTLLKQRTPLYQATANYVVDTENIDTDDLVSQIARLLEQQVFSAQ